MGPWDRMVQGPPPLGTEVARRARPVPRGCGHPASLMSQVQDPAKMMKVSKSDSARGDSRHSTSATQLRLKGKS